MSTANDRREPTEAFSPRTPPQQQRTYSFSGEGDMSYVDRDIPQGSFLGQFAASVKKNVLQKLRDKVSCCLEIMLPLLFVCGLLGIWAATSSKTYPGESFINSSQPMLDTKGIRTLFCSNGTNLTAYTPCSLFPSFKTAPEYICAPETNNDLCFNGTLATGLVYYWLNEWSNAKAVPTLDQIIHFMWLAKAVIPRTFADGQYQSVYSAVVRTGKLHFIANNGSQAYINQLVQYFDAKAPVIFQRYVLGNIYTSQAAANSFVEGVDTEGTVWGMVALNEVSATDIDFSVQLNRSGVPWTNRVQDRFTSGGLGQKQFEQYYSSGFLSLQATVNEFWFEVVKGVTPPNELYGAPMPYVAWTQSTFLQAAGQLAPLLIVLSFLYPVSQQTKRIVEEKERRVREAMMIMGLGTGGFYASWVVTYAMLYFVTSVGATILLKVTFAKHADPLILFFLYYFFCLSCISLSGALSAFFSKSRLAATMAPLIFFVVAVPFFAIGNTTPRGPLLILSLLSPSAFSIGCSLVFNYEMGTGISAKDMGSQQDTLNMAAVYFFLLFDSVWYFLLALYLDGVLPAEWGSREHPCFCYLRCFRLCSSSKGQPEGVLNDARDPRGQYEPDPKGRPSVMLRGLRRVFERDSSRFVAVNDLTLNLYEGQITVLLGHNGAGKTTAINLMTGMLDPTAGDCVVYGKSIHTDMAAVRQEIGFCPQHNILWPELTCREHLEYFGKLKGLSGDELETAVIEMLKAVDLFDKIDYPSENLSGGQKRKLSVAIAFVGRSRVIFLDEPTAGMDVGARRHTWDLIRRMSVGRTIVLTTHYMDEADLLGHSIAIMSKGRLKCKGSSLFLKSRLGVGYTLSVSVDAAAQFSTIEAIVRQSIPSMDVLGSGSGELAYRLPMAEVPNFPSMLAQLEERGTSLGVRSFGISVTTIEEVFLKIAEDEEQNEELVRSPAPLTPQPELLEEDRGNPHAWAQYRNHESPLLRQFRALVIKRFHNIKRDRRTQCFQVVTPVVCLLLAMLFTLVKFPNSPNLPLTPAMYGEAVEVVYADCPVWAGKAVFTPGVTAYNVSAPNADAVSTYLQDTFKKHGELRTTAFYCNDSAGGRPFMMYNASRGVHSAPEAMQVYYNAYAKGQGLGVNMAVASWPLPLTARESAFVDAIMSLIIGIFIMIPFTFIPSTFVSWVVKERECKAKHLQTISGMNFAVYWVSNFVFDILSFIITTFLAILVFLIFNRKEYIGGGEQFGATFILFLLYGLAGVTGSYLASFAFDNHASAQNVVMLANFICGFLLVLLNYFLVAIASTSSAGKALRYVFRIVPSYCLGEGIINLASHQLTVSLGNNDSVFSMDVIGWNCIYLVIEFPLFAALTMLLDHPSRQRRAQQLFHEPDVLPPPIPNEDADVVQERIEVETGARPSDVVRIKNMCKVYPTGKGPKVAVKNLSLGVKPGEVFGFLGTNGAGKTTTISILCGEQLPTHGRGWVNGHDVVDDATAARRAVGYCPQFDALLDLLTAEEHLRLYAGLRGLEVAHIDAVVQSLIQSVGLAEHRKTLAMNMSGGNRRKLSVAVALVGAPLVVFLDEPSAGMDPLARRGLWDVIEAIASKCSVVLTTHHLEEVEALAHRVGIMVNGELRCIGTLQQLKHKFGSGFELSMRVASESRVQGLRTYMASAFPTAVEQEFRSLKFTFALPQDTQLSQTFRKIEEVKEQLAITDYSLSQTSLEQVFLRIGADATSEE